MSAELVFASVAISLALFFYTWGVFGERRGGTLSLKYVLLFWIGLACDTTGTLTMSNIASQSAASGFGIHAITGVVAIVLMLVHALWATFTYKRGSQQARRRFHTFSTVVCWRGSCLYHWHARGHPRHPPAGRVRHRHQRHHRGDLGCHFVRKRTQEE